MKKATKKLLTLALSTLFVGAGLGGSIAAYNAYTATVASADTTGLTKLETPIACAMPLEEGKVKNITDWGYYTDGTENIWYFSGNGTATAQPEIRFSTPGTDTTPGSSDRVYKPMTVNSISVDYKITNTGTQLAESSTTKYLLQILGATEGTGSANCYYYHIPNIIDDGQWHTLTIDLTSEFTGGKEGMPTATTFDDINEIVCCWNFKMGADFNGEVMFKDFVVREPATITEVNVAEGSLKGDWNTIVFTDCWMYRFWMPNAKWTNTNITTTDKAWYSEALLDTIKINGKSINEWTAAWKAGEVEVTWDGAPTWIGNSAILDRIGACVSDGHPYMPIDITLCNHGTAGPGGTGGAVDMYIPKSMIPVVNTIEFTSEFEWVEGDVKYTTGEGITYYGNSFDYIGSYVGANAPASPVVEAIPTTIVKAGHHLDNLNGDALHFYLGTSDYLQENGDPVARDVVLADDAYYNYLKSIQYYDYIEIDGVKLGSLMKKSPKANFLNVWGEYGSFATVFPAELSSFESHLAIQTIKVLKGAQFPSYENSMGKVYEVQEDVTLVRMSDGCFANTNTLLNANNVTIAEAVDFGDQNEIIKFTLSSDMMAFSGDAWDMNGDNAKNIAVRQNILLNGVSLYDINASTDDSAYNYATFPWTHERTDLFQHPTLVAEEGNSIVVYVHKTYLENMGYNTLNVTFKKGLTTMDNNGIYVGEDITATVWKKPVNVNVIVGSNPKLDPNAVYTVSGKYGESFTLETPTAAGKEFAGWQDVEGNAVTEFVFTEDTAIFAAWNVTPYTLTIVNGEATEEIIFAVEYTNEIMASVNDIAYILSQKLPASTSEMTYAWAEEVPEVFELQDYTFTVYAQPIIAEETAFKFGFYNKTKDATYYATGAMDGYYMGTTANALEAADVYVEAVEGKGYKFYFMDGETKKYISIVVSNGYINMAINEEGIVFYYDVLGFWYANVNGTAYYPGSYTKSNGTTYTTISASKASYITTSNIGVSQFPAVLTDTYTLTLKNGNPYMGGTVETYNVPAGVALNLPTLTAEGKNFLGWVSVSYVYDEAMDDFIETILAAPETMPAEALILQANWEIVTYDVKITLPDGKTITLMLGIEDVYNEDPMQAVYTTFGISWAIEDILATMSDNYYLYTVENLPEEFELKAYEFTATQVERKFVAMYVYGDMMESEYTMEELKFGDALNFPALEQAGKTLVGWVYYTYEFDEDWNEIEITNPAPETMIAEEYLVLYPVWEVEVYTVTIVNGETTETIKFAVEADPVNSVGTLEDLAFAISMMLPEDTAEFTYAWAEEIPETFKLKDYTFTVVATAVEVTPPEGGDEGEVTPPEGGDEPEVPGDEPTDEPEVPGDEPTDEPEQPSEQPEDPATSEEPSILDKVTGMIPGCAGVVGGVAGGVAALGIAVVALLKKKEDNE